MNHLILQESTKELLMGRQLKITNADGTTFIGKCRGILLRQIRLDIPGREERAINHGQFIAFEREPDDSYPLSRIIEIQEVKP